MPDDDGAQLPLDSTTVYWWQRLLLNSNTCGNPTKVSVNLDAVLSCKQQEMTSRKQHDQPVLGGK
jgi:hypothetical protein